MQPSERLTAKQVATMLELEFAAQELRVSVRVKDGVAYLHNHGSPNGAHGAAAKRFEEIKQRYQIVDG